MKLLLQGGWTAERNAPESRMIIEAYCRTIAKYVIENNQTIVLTSNRDYDKLVAEEVAASARRSGKNIKNHLMFILPEREKYIPQEGRVIRLPKKSWWIEERTYYIQNTDALIAIGGGKGTFDCVEKAFLARKPVFVPSAIQCRALSAWQNRENNYKYIVEGDADVLDDVSLSPDEFFLYVFSIVNSLSAIAYTRRVFIVHGHNHHVMDILADILRKLDFEPVVLQDTSSKSLTIIEKLERDTEKVGFAFILYTPDDVGKQQGGTERTRARQNVVFEHGLLIGLLGRERTCALVQGEVEIPSDIRGMIYEEINELKGEALKIAKLLRDAGYKLDASKLL